MQVQSQKPTVLLVDDNEDFLGGLRDEVQALLDPETFDIKIWVPRYDRENVDSDQNDAQLMLRGLVGKNTVFVATDKDLTQRGQTGLFGETVVAFCQRKAIPVGEYSRDPKSDFTRPNFFEFLIPNPRKIVEAAREIALLATGFWQLQQIISERSDDILGMGSPAEVLAVSLGRPHLESNFAMYANRLGGTNAALLTKISSQNLDNEDKLQIFTYSVGHLLKNAIIKYPGPLVAKEALCAYLAVSEPSFDEHLAPLFTEAEYKGPFSGGRPIFWKEDVDEVLEPLVEALAYEVEGATLGELHRLALEKSLAVRLAKHITCDRCEGRNGGFYCPITEKVVCLEENCSVSSSSWIPQGAHLCRLDYEYYHEWAPLLGL